MYFTDAGTFSLGTGRKIVFTKKGVLVMDEAYDASRLSNTVVVVLLARSDGIYLAKVTDVAY